MQVKKGGIFWGKPTPQALAVISSWDFVILNEANTYSMSEQPEAGLFVERLKANNPDIKIAISFNSYSVPVDKFGKPSVYFPICVKIHEAATKYNAWLKVNDNFVETRSPNGSINRLFDIRIKPFRDELAAIINAAFATYPKADLLFFDELHYTVRFFPNPELMPTDEEWMAATYSFLTKIKYPFMGNGTYNLSLYHKTKSRGRYVQNANDQQSYSLKTIQDIAIYLRSDLALPAKQRFTTLNIIGTFDRTMWGKFAYGIDAFVQTYPGGVKENFADYKIDSLTF